MVLNLGSGKNLIEGAINLDKNPETKAEIIWDLNLLPIPLADNRFDYITARHILEHLQNVVGVMNEIHRIGSNGAGVVIEVPHYANPIYYDDPTHVRPFGDNTIPLMCDSIQAKIFGIKGKFDLLEHIILGELWSREKPMVIVAKLRVVK